MTSLMKFQKPQALASRKEMITSKFLIKEVVNENVKFILKLSVR